MNAHDQQADGARRREDRRFAGQLASLGVNIAVGMILFSMGGYWLDRRQGSGMKWTLTGMFVGLAYGGYEVWKVIRVLDRQSADRPKPGAPGSGSPDDGPKGGA